MDLFGIVCFALSGLLMLQVILPGAAFCMKDGSRVIACRSLMASPVPPAVSGIDEAACCNKTCREKPEAAPQTHSPSDEYGKSSCCISLESVHDGVVCLSFSGVHVLETVTFLDPIEPFYPSNGYPLNSATEKPPFMAALRTVVLIL